MRTILSVAVVGLIAMLVLTEDSAATYSDNMYQTFNATWTCSDGGLNCQTDNASLTYYAESSISLTGKTRIASMLLTEVHPTDLNVSLESPPVYSGGSETDIIFKYDSSSPVPGYATCDDANSSTTCDQHYVVFNTSTPESRLICHEAGHAVGLVHGDQAYPAVPDSDVDLGCMGTHPSGTGLGSWNQYLMNATY